MNYDVKKLHVELTDKCNARCPLCTRTDSTDISKTTHFVKNVEITLEEYKKITEGIQFKTIVFCGNYGDPLSAKDFLKILEYVATPDCNIRIDTNASVKTPAYFKRIGEILSINPNNLLSFDLDGLEDTHSFYRRNTNFNKIIENAKAYIENTTARSNWQFLVFEHNKHQMDDAKALAKEIGFTDFQYRYSSWFDGSGEATFYDNGVKNVIVKADPPTKVQFLDKINCKSIEQGEIYLSAQGYLWPCCHTASRYTTDPDLKQIVDLCGIDSINAKKYSVQEIMEGMIWSEIENRWPSKRPMACKGVCSRVNNRSVDQNVVLR